MDDENIPPEILKVALFRGGLFQNAEDDEAACSDLESDINEFLKDFDPADIKKVYVAHGSGVRTALIAYKWLKVGD